MAVPSPRRTEHRGCGEHRAYRSKKEAEWRVSWHLSCGKCRRGLVMRVWPCPDGQSFHVGHGRPWMPP
jgi:hypothetical protein